MSYKDPNKQKEYKREYYLKNKDKFKKKRLERYYKNKEKENEYMKKYYKDNSDKFKIYDKKKRKSKKWKDYIKKYHKEHPEDVKKSKSKFKRTFKGKLLSRKHARLRRLRERNIKESFTQNEWLQKLNETNGYCPKCYNYFGIENLTLDHIIPISKVPEWFVYTIDDIRPLCNSCNASKCDKMEELK